MRAHIPGRYAAMALLLGGLACAGNKNTDDGTVVAQDSTRARDTSAYQAPARDTTAVPQTDTSMAAPAPTPTPADTSTYQPTQPSNQPTDTSTNQTVPSAAPTDTSSYAPAAPADTNSSSGVERSDTLNGNKQSGYPDSSTSSPSPSANDTTGGMVHDSSSMNK